MEGDNAKHCEVHYMLHCTHGKPPLTVWSGICQEPLNCLKD